MQRQQAIYGKATRKLSDSYESDNDNNQPEPFQKTQAFPQQKTK